MDQFASVAGLQVIKATTVCYCQSPLAFAAEGGITVFNRGETAPNLSQMLSLVTFGWLNTVIKRFALMESNGLPMGEISSLNTCFISFFSLLCNFYY